MFVFFTFSVLLSERGERGEREREREREREKQTVKWKERCTISYIS